MYKLLLVFSLLSITGCETVDSMQQDVTDFSNDLFATATKGTKDDASDAFFKAQEAYSEAEKARKQKVLLNAQQRSLWAELESDYQKLVENPDTAADKESIFSDGTIADNIMTQSLEFIELAAKTD
ncbi:hypothetical protein B5G52_10385 [Pseudoalteromonas sp. A601]|uniref:hypothetical protein n=1 Tax=Pseudoalteromonas sp. A601 TaxID=1967839 RepID=UPI000B3D3F03|nr:hypothetical protein [Pseudoalteromonas sp. A601]OUS71798.1 hypothetical protein B5G52_10385 [Pseudoalteromonas sp. A601]